MRTFFACFNAELARRTLVAPDGTHVNYWGPALPVALFATVATLGYAVALADPRVAAAPVMLGTAAGYYLLTAGRLAAGTPASPPPGSAASAAMAYVCRYVASLLPLLVEMAVLLPLLCLLAGAPCPWRAVLGLSLLTAMAGHFWSVRSRTPADACRRTYGVAMALWAGWEINAAVPGARLPLSDLLGSFHLPVPVALHGHALMVLLGGFGLAPVLAESVGRLGLLGMKPAQAWSGAPIPTTASPRFLWQCIRQSMSWGVRPWARYVPFESLRESWYAIGICSVLFVGIIYCSALTWVASRDSTELARCRQNENTIGTALQSYALDHQGQYPGTLDELVPGYLQRIPACPAAGTDTYSGDYVSNGSRAYTLYCDGAHHTGAGLSPDYPQFGTYLSTGLGR